jgi:hypothetical protein
LTKAAPVNGLGFSDQGLVTEMDQEGRGRRVVDPYRRDGVHAAEAQQARQAPAQLAGRQSVPHLLPGRVEALGASLPGGRHIACQDKGDSGSDVLPSLIAEPDILWVEPLEVASQHGVVGGRAGRIEIEHLTEPPDRGVEVSPAGRRQPCVAVDHVEDVRQGLGGDVACRREVIDFAHRDLKPWTTTPSGGQRWTRLPIREIVPSKTSLIADVPFSRWSDNLLTRKDNGGQLWSSRTGCYCMRLSFSNVRRSACETRS